MKNLFTTLFLTLFLSAATAKSFIDEITEIAGVAPDVNINLGTGIIKTIMAFSGDEDAKEVSKLMKGLDKIRVSVFEFENSKNNANLLQAITKKVGKLTSKGYESIVTVKEDEGTVHIMAKVKDKALKDAMIIVLEKDEMVVISLNGTLDLQQLAQISDHFNVDVL